MSAPAGRRVLIVEDDALSLKLMKDVLEVDGYAVDQVVVGSEALPRVLKQRPDLVVIDIGLPGTNGIEVTRLLKQDSGTATIPVLAVSAYAMPSDEARMREAGCDAFMTKPLSFAAFVAEVARLIGEAPTYPPERGRAK